MPPKPHVGGSTRSPKRLSLQQSLDVAKDEAQIQGYVFAQNCFAELTQILASLPADQPPDPDKDEKDHETAIRLLVREMAKVGRRLNFAQLFEDTLKEAKFTLCPMWPFC